MSSQEIFAKNLLANGPIYLEGLKTWNGSDPLLRYAVYRNNVIVSLIDALADTFPVTLALVGGDFFRAMARVFVQEHPPKSRVLAWVGEDFPYFILKFPHIYSLPYLADVAQLEMNRINAYHAADVPALDMNVFNIFLSKPQILPSLKLKLHPSLSLIHSSHAVFSIWAAHHGKFDFSSIDICNAETALIFRNGLYVETLCVTSAEGYFIQHLLSMGSIESATNQTTHYDTMFDVSGIMTLLIEKQLITKYLEEGQ